jgi:hypothetical protein
LLKLTNEPTITDWPERIAALEREAAGVAQALREGARMESQSDGPVRPPGRWYAVNAINPVIPNYGVYDVRGEQK